MDQPAIREAVRSILTAIGEEPDRPGMEATPDVEALTSVARGAVRRNAATSEEAMRLIRDR